MRKYNTDRTREILEEFSDLGRIKTVFETPIIQKKQSEDIRHEVFAKMLQEVYSSNNTKMEVNLETIKTIPHFTIDELVYALSCMKKRRGADKFNIIIEMVKHVGFEFHAALLKMYNDIIACGAIPNDWHITVFTMLPKIGDLTEPSNWRPIAILPILYIKRKDGIFSGVFYAKFATPGDRIKSLSAMKNSFSEGGGQGKWANIDLPSDIRAPEAFVTRLKKILLSAEWGFAEGSVWYNIEGPSKYLKVEGKIVLTVSCAEGGLVFEWEEKWKNWEELHGDAEIKALVENSTKLISGGEKGKELTHGVGGLRMTLLWQN